MMQCGVVQMFVIYVTCLPQVLCVYVCSDRCGVLRWWDGVSGAASLARRRGRRVAASVVTNVQCCAEDNRCFPLVRSLQNKAVQAVRRCQERMRQVAVVWCRRHHVFSSSILWRTLRIATFSCVMFVPSDVSRPLNNTRQILNNPECTHKLHVLCRIAREHILDTKTRHAANDVTCPHFLSTLMNANRLSVQQIEAIVSELFIAGIDSVHECSNYMYMYIRHHKSATTNE